MKSNGIGLKFLGYPTDIKRYFWILAEEGCHPKAGQRILDRIKEKGFDLLTVQSNLHFDWIIEKLGEIGVEVKYIEGLMWKASYDDGPWPREALPDRFKMGPKL